MEKASSRGLAMDEAGPKLIQPGSFSYEAHIHLQNRPVGLKISSMLLQNVYTVLDI